jgi:sec-independent protein translocase protein TatA
VPFNVGPLEIIVVLVVVFAIFGAKRVPELARSVGSGIHEIRGSLSLDDKEEAATGSKSPEAGDSSGSESPGTQPRA